MSNEKKSEETEVVKDEARELTEEELEQVSGGVAHLGTNTAEYRIVDLDTYKRKTILEYFLSLSSPQTGFTVDVDVTELIRFCKENRCSFFLTFLHIAALSADSVPQFRHRLHRLTEEEKKDPRHSKYPDKGPFKDLEIRVYEKCPTSHTEQGDSETYCYCYLNHHMPWKEYIETATEIQRKARIDASLSCGPEALEVYYLLSCVPWVRYTDCIHPWGNQFDSNPRIGWGKYEADFRGRMMMPVTVRVHHGLVDGQHIALFFKKVDDNIKKLTEGYDPYAKII